MKRQRVFASDTREYTRRGQAADSPPTSPPRDAPLLHTTDPQDEAILDRLNDVRGKFKSTVALLGMHHEYSPKESSLSLEF